MDRATVGQPADITARTSSIFIDEVIGSLSGPGGSNQRDGVSNLLGVGSTERPVQKEHASSQQEYNSSANSWLPEIFVANEAERDKTKTSPENSEELKADDIENKVGSEAAMGVSMLGATSVIIANDNGAIKITMNRAGKGEYEAPLVSPPLIFGEKFDFTIASGKKEGTLELTNIKGLSVSIDGKKQAVSNLTMKSEGWKTTLTLDVKDKDGKPIKISVPLTNTYDGFSQFLGYGEKLKKS